MNKLKIAAKMGSDVDRRMISLYPPKMSNAAPKIIGPMAEPITLIAIITPNIPLEFRALTRKDLQKRVRNC